MSVSDNVLTSVAVAGLRDNRVTDPRLILVKKVEAKIADGEPEMTILKTV